MTQTIDSQKVISPQQRVDAWLADFESALEARDVSLHLALQLKARYEGLETPVYGLQEVHHLS